MKTSKEIENQQKELIINREDFFDFITKNLMKDPSEIDEIMGQNKYFCAPKLESDSYINDPENGVLYFKFEPSFFGHKFDFGYSIFNPGDWLWIGVLFNNENETNNIMTTVDNCREIDAVWDRTPENNVRDGNSILMEWRFHEPDLYSNFLVQERFAFVIRHMHLRILRMLATNAGASK